MLLSNWLTPLLLGAWYGQRSGQSGPKPSMGAWPAALALTGGLVLWAFVAERLPFVYEFPFMKLAVGNALVGSLLVSVITSALYVGVTWLTFQAVLTLSAPAPVRFVARNSLIIFLVHMPLYYIMEPALTPLIDSRLLRSTLYAIACVIGLGLLSEALHWLVNPRGLRDRLIGLVRRPESATS
jgi:hypothetical protein